jgi:hypothetical protein
VKTRILPFLPILALLLSGCVFLYGPQFLPQQPRPVLSQGRRVRVYVPASDDYVRIATLVALTADSIVLERAPTRTGWDVPSAAPLRTTLPLGAVGRLEVSRGFQGHLEEGLVAGAIVGGALALAIGDCHGDGLGFGCHHDERMPFAFVPVVLLGGFLGSRIETERWNEVSLDEVHRLRVGLTPQPAGRIGLGASLAF